MEKIIIFESDKDLMELTGVSSLDELWKARWDLDDWDYGIQTDEEWEEMDVEKDLDWYTVKQYRSNMAEALGYIQIDHYIWNGKHYYIKHH